MRSRRYDKSSNDAAKISSRQSNGNLQAIWLRATDISAKLHGTLFCHLSKYSVVNHPSRKS